MHSAMLTSARWQKLMMLGAAKGDSITISAAGDGAEAAVSALCELVEAKFGED